jgi:LacI family transcriptional regulator
MANIYDVARESGFSTATVSKVFNHYAGVNAITKAKVLESAKRCGYIPNVQNSDTVKEKSWLIGVFYKESIGIGFTHPHFGEILQSFKETVESAGYELIFFNNNYSNSRFSYVEHCQFRNVDGVLIVDGSIPPREAADMESNGYKCVSLENYYTDIPTVISNNTVGTIQALNYLYTLGHRKIAMIAELDSNSNKERFKAYKTFLKQKHIPYRENLVTFCDGYSFEAYKEATDKLLDQSLGDFPTGIFTTFDHIAISVQKALLKRGYKIPNDISVIGFDDISMSKSVTPSLTTIRQNRSEIGVRAAEILLQRLINDDEVNHTKVTRIETKLVVRNSTGRAKK